MKKKTNTQLNLIYKSSTRYNKVYLMKRINKKTTTTTHKLLHITITITYYNNLDHYTITKRKTTHKKNTKGKFYIFEERKKRKTD